MMTIAIELAPDVVQEITVRAARMGLGTAGYVEQLAVRDAQNQYRAIGEIR